MGEFERTTFATTGVRDTDAVIDRLERREEASLKQRKAATDGADRAHLDALTAARRADLRGVEVALVRLARFAHTAGRNAQIADQCSQRLAGLDPSAGHQPLPDALAEAIETATAARATAAAQRPVAAEIGAAVESLQRAERRERRARRTPRGLPAEIGVAG